MPFTFSNINLATTPNLFHIIWFEFLVLDRPFLIRFCVIYSFGFWSYFKFCNVLFFSLWPTVYIFFSWKNIELQAWADVKKPRLFRCSNSQITGCVWFTMGKSYRAFRQAGWGCTEIQIWDHINICICSNSHFIYSRHSFLPLHT